VKCGPKGLNRLHFQANVENGDRAQRERLPALWPDRLQVDEFRDLRSRPHHRRNSCATQWLVPRRRKRQAGLWSLRVEIRTGEGSSYQNRRTGNLDSISANRFRACPIKPSRLKTICCFPRVARISKTQPRQRFSELPGMRKIVVPLFAAIVLLASVFPAEAARSKKPRHHHQSPLAPAEPVEETEAPKPAKDASDLSFNFFAAGGGGEEPSGTHLDLNPEQVAAKGETRRWMLKTHQTLGIATWFLLGSAVVVGQLNYNQLYGGGGSNKWQTPHRWLVLSASAAFVATAAFAIFAPKPYARPLRFDTSLVHRLAAAGATLGMLTEVILGITTTNRANVGNQRNLRTLAQAHQIIGYSTFGLLTLAGTVWIF